MLTHEYATMSLADWPRDNEFWSMSCQVVYMGPDQYTVFYAVSPFDAVAFDVCRWEIGDHEYGWY